MKQTYYVRNIHLKNCLTKVIRSVMMYQTNIWEKLTIIAFECWVEHSVSLLSCRYAFEWLNRYNRRPLKRFGSFLLSLKLRRK